MMLKGENREALDRAIGSLSEIECEALLRIAKGFLKGDHAPAEDAAIFYNEYVKATTIATATHLALALPRLAETDAGVFGSISIQKRNDTAPSVILPASLQVTMPVGECLRGRRSTRSFGTSGISLQEVATLLNTALGLTGSVMAYGYDALPLRAFPSSGGLQAVEVYVFARAVSDLSPGAYHYVPAANVLECIEAGDFSTRISSAALNQGCASEAAAVIAIAVHYGRVKWKYGERGYRYACIDVGCATANLYAVATSLGLACCAVAGFLEAPLETILGLDSREEMLVLLMTFGAPAPRADA